MLVIERYMIEDLKLSGAELLVYADVVSNLNSANLFNKAYSDITKDTALAPKTIYRAIKKLKEMKLINIKRARDGRRIVNLILVNDRHIEIVKDSDFEDLLKFYNLSLDLNEEKCQKNYAAYKVMIKDKDYTTQKFKDAIRCYRDTMKDREYYKTYLYSFDKFVSKYKLYLPNGFEYEQYKIFYDSRLGKNRMNNSDRGYEIEECEACCCDRDELDNIEV